MHRPSYIQLTTKRAAHVIYETMPVVRRQLAVQHRKNTGPVHDVHCDQPVEHADQVACRSQNHDSGGCPQRAIGA